MGCFHAHCKFQKPDSISFPDQTENLLLKLTKEIEMHIMAKCSKPVFFKQLAISSHLSNDNGC